jgi:hypothetical protein
MDSIVSWILQLALQAVGIFIQNKQQKLELERKIKEAIEQYKKGVTDAAKVRDEHKKLDNKLDDAWNKKFGTTASTPPPTEVKVNESFFFELSLPQGKKIEVWAEKQYYMGAMGWNSLLQKYQLALAFNQPGVRVISVKLDGEWEPNCSQTITVRS